MALYFHEKTVDGFNARKVDEVLCQVKTPYQEVVIVKHALLGRTLYLDDHFQSDDSFQSDYHRFMVSLASSLMKKHISEVLICGSGPGGLAKACFSGLWSPRILAVELDEQAYFLYNQFLQEWGPQENLSKVHQVFADVFQSLNCLGISRFDAVFWDIDVDTLPEVVWEDTFFDLKRVLKPNGAFVATAGFIVERAKNDPYRIFIEEAQKAFPEGTLAEFTRMNWNFFGATNASKLPARSEITPSTVAHE